MPLYLDHNPYQGINAHLNSLLQIRYGGWEMFHAEHIIDLRRLMSAVLPAGYRAVPERSLQIRDADDSHVNLAFPDVGIIRSPFSPPLILPSPSPSAPTLEAPLTALSTLAEPRYTYAVKIYDREGGQLITRLEILSPSNKQRPAAYLEMREVMWQNGVNLVELDYLHTLPHLFRGIFPLYPDEDTAYPFHITVIHPFREKISLYGVHVNDPLPTISIPLREAESFPFDFEAAYQLTLQQGQSLYDRPDYAQLPHSFERYHPADQARIQAVMTRIQSSAAPHSSATV